MQIVLDTRGMQMSVRNACFLFETEADSRIVHPSRISSILITAPIRISSPALILAATSQIPVIMCDQCGRPQVRTWSPRFINTSKLRRDQYRFATTPQSADWDDMITRLKIEGQKDNLRFVANRKPSLGAETEKAIFSIDQQLESARQKTITTIGERKKQILFMEAYSASLYWQLFGKVLPAPFTFSNRVKKMPPDGFNACINYLYGMLRNQVETAVLSIGLDPAIGIMHRDGYKMTSLVFDLMEPFRPMMDRLLITTILQNEFGADTFDVKDESLLITKAGRKQLIGLFVKKLHTRTSYRGTTTSLNNHLLTEAKLLATTIKTND
jgi:CRISPR-associated protein Cas1